MCLGMHKARQITVFSYVESKADMWVEVGQLDPRRFKGAGRHIDRHRNVYMCTFNLCVYIHVSMNTPVISRI